MTSQEILKASMLDILFENRNKQYGAYDLRKFYANRMGVALAISLSSVLLVLLLIPSAATSTNASLLEKPDIVVTAVDLPKPPEAEPAPPAARPPEATQRASVDYQNIEIVPDQLADPALPTTDDLTIAVISNTIADGVMDTGEPAPAANIAGSGTTPTNSVTSESPVFDPIEKQPEFPGGVEAWRNFLSRYLQAPDELEAGERRTVQVRFMVNATGVVTNFEIIQSAGTSFDREVIRVLKKMPKWKPAIQNGQEIGVSFVQPVTFEGIQE